MDKYSGMSGNMRCNSLDDASNQVITVNVRHTTSSADISSHHATCPCAAAVARREQAADAGRPAGQEST